MANVAEGLAIALQLVEAIGRIGARLKAVGATIKQAQDEGRDLTDAEIEEIRSARKSAVEPWRTSDAG